MPRKKAGSKYTPKQLEHIIRYYRPPGSVALEDDYDLELPEVRPYDYPVKRFIGGRSAILLRAKHSGAPGAPRFGSTDESISVIEHAAVTLAKEWKRRLVLPAEVAKRHRISADVVRKGKSSPATAAPAIIAAMRTVVVDGNERPCELSKQTFDRLRSVYRTLHQDLRGLREVRASFEAFMDTFLLSSPPPASEYPRRHSG